MLKKLLFVLVIALVLRLFLLTSIPNGLYWDEIDVGYQALSLLQTGRDYFGNTMPLFLHSLADYRAPVFLYSAVPVVDLFGFSQLGIRLVPLIWGLAGVAAMYVLGARLVKSGTLAAVVAAISIWHFQYSRVAQEPIAMVTCMTVALAAWLRGSRSKIWYYISAIFFALSIASYSTAKLFVPVFLFLLYLINRFRLPKAPIILLIILSSPIYLNAVFGASNTRFHDISIFTDPVISSEINQKRLESAIGLKGDRVIGMMPNIIDKLVYNKPEEIFSRFVKNYLAAYSTDFLFIKGDSQLRHSPGKDSIGMLFMIEIIPLVIGLWFTKKLSTSRRQIIVLWLLLTPLSASLTRDGAAHASRLIGFLPILLPLVAYGVTQLFNKQIYKYTYIVALLLSCLSTYYFYFTRYSLESPISFHWGFEQAIEYAIDKSPQYDRVVVDMAGEPSLMAYLFVTKYSPAEFQSLGLSNYKTVSDMPGYEFGKLILLNPGSRNWADISGHGNTLVISSAFDNSLDSMPNRTRILNYPDGSPAFYSQEFH